MNNTLVIKTPVSSEEHRSITKFAITESPDGKTISFTDNWGYPLAVLIISGDLLEFNAEPVAALFKEDEDVCVFPFHGFTFVDALLRGNSVTVLLRSGDRLVRILWEMSHEYSHISGHYCDWPNDAYYWKPLFFSGLAPSDDAS